MRKVPAGMKTCGIPSMGEVRMAEAVGEGGRGEGVGEEGEGIAVDVAGGSTFAVAVAGTRVEVGSATGTCEPVQAARRNNRRKVGMSLFMDPCYGVKRRAA
jgi:hypothetical protein